MSLGATAMENVWTPGLVLVLGLMAQTFLTYLVMVAGEKLIDNIRLD